MLAAIHVTCFWDIRRSNLGPALAILVNLSWADDGHNSISIATRLWVGQPGFDPGEAEDIHISSTMSRPALGFVEPSIPWVPGELQPGVKRQGRDADHSPPSSAEVKNGGALTPLPHTSSGRGA
jgi:hypothetical protein